MQMTIRDLGDCVTCAYLNHVGGNDFECYKDGELSGMCDRYIEYESPTPSSIPGDCAECKWCKSLASDRYVCRLGGKFVGPEYCGEYEEIDVGRDWVYEPLYTKHKDITKIWDLAGRAFAEVFTEAEKENRKLDRKQPEEKTTVIEYLRCPPIEIKEDRKQISGKPLLAAVPPHVIEAIGAVLTYGNGVYGVPDSWKNGEPQTYRHALMRHICKYLREPFGLDEDSKLPHLYHVAANVAILLYLQESEGYANE